VAGRQGREEGRTISCRRSRKPGLTAVGIRCVDHATPSIRNSWH
jgi:hypothetical protein